MIQAISNFFVNIFGNNIVLATILISMLPIFELRGAIPFATNSGIWQALAMSNWRAFGWSLLGSSLLVPVLALIFIPIIRWLKKTKIFKKLAISIENHVKSKVKNVENAEEKSERFSKVYWKKMLFSFIFVAIPLPFTGVWTGTCVAVFLGLDFWSCCASVIAGNVVAGILITLILQFFPWLNDWLLYIFIALVLIILVYELIKTLIKKNTNKDKGTTNE